MSDEMLTPEAPEDGAAVETPAPETAAAGGSVESPDSVSATRFNGLMARYNADKESAAAELAAARAEIERLKATPVKETKRTVTDDSTADEIRQLRETVARMELGRARDAALAKYPGAAPLADLIMGDSPEAIEEVARTLQERLAGLTPAPAGGDSSAATSSSGDAATGGTTPETPAVPVLGGAVAVDDEVTSTEAVNDAVVKGDFSAFWAAAERRAHETHGADLTVG